MLYLVDRPLASTAFRIAAEDDDAHVVLIQDGVLCDPDLDARTYALGRDAERRGADLADDVEVLTYESLVTMLFEHDVKTFA